MSNTTPFLHIAYANNNTGTLDFTTTGGIKRTHTGFYTDEYSTDSSDPTKYKWLTNEEFTNKVNTVAYANSADGTDGFTTVYPNLNLLNGSMQYTKDSPKTLTSNKIDGIQLLTDVYVKNLKAGTYTLNAKTDGVWVNHLSTTDPEKHGVGLWLWSTTDSGVFVQAGNTVPKVITVTRDGDYCIRVNTYSDGITNVTQKFWDFKLEKGSIATQQMPSASEVTTADYPKFVGFSNVTNPTGFKDYEWTLLENVPKKILNTHVAYATPPVVDDMHILTMPTVKSINVTYGIGTLTTKPVTWLSAKPKLDVNQVLWYKSEITGTDDSVGTYYSNAIGGANLDDGDLALDNTVTSIVLNNKIINIPSDLALKLELLSQTLNKRDNELAQSIADTNNRITNIDMITGLEGLEQERTERKAGDEALKTQITTNLGTETDHYNQLTERLVENEAKSGRSIIQGTAFVGSNEPSIFLDHINKKAFLRYQIPGDITYQVKEVEFNYETGIEFRDELSLLVWSKSMSDSYGGFTWRDTIKPNSDTDTLYLTGINSLFLLDGSLLIRGEVYFSDASEAIGNMNNRGFLAKYANIVVAPDAKSVKSIRLIGKMGVVTESFSIDATATWTVERYDNVVTITNSPKLDTNTTTAGSWVNLSQKVPYGLRPKSNKEISCGVITTNNLFMIGVGSNGALKYHQATSNANKYIAAGGISWPTLNEYLPQGWQSNVKWVAR